MNHPKNHNKRGFRPESCLLILMLCFVSILLIIACLPNNVSADVFYQRLDGMSLVNQEGRSGDLLSDYIGQKITVVTFAYSNCTTACPILDGIFKNVQKRLSEEERRYVNLLTITIDPENDIPARLKQRAERLNAESGWEFLTGSRKQVDAVLKAFEVFSTDIYSHPSTVFILDAREEKHLRLAGFPSAKNILAYIEKYQKERQKP